MRAFTLRSAERQVELQEVPPGLSDHRSAAGAASANEHLPAATQVRSFFLSKPGWIGLTIILQPTRLNVFAVFFIHLCRIRVIWEIYIGKHTMDRSCDLRIFIFIEKLEAI